MRSLFTISLLSLFSFVFLPLSGQDFSLGLDAVAFNGLAISLDAEGQGEFCAQDFVPPHFFDCTIEEVLLGRATGSLNDAAEFLTVNCDDIGVLIVAVWVRDANDNWSSSETFTLVQDPFGNCESGTPDPSSFNIKTIAGLSVNLDETGQFTAHARDFVVGCNDAGIQYSFSAVTTDTTKVITCDDLGTFVVQIWGTAGSGTQNYSETYILIESMTTECPGNALPDCTPNILLINGLVVNIPESGVLLLHVDDFVRTPVFEKECQAGAPINYSFSEAPDDKWLQIDCSSSETTLVRVYGTDEAGNQAYNDTYLLVQDNLSLCDPPTPAVATNDLICDAISLDPFLGGCPVRFSNVGAGAEAGEPTPELGGCSTAGFWCDNTADATLWYTFTAPSVGGVLLETNGFNTQIAVWEGADCQAILHGEGTLVGAADDLSSTDTLGSRLSLACLVPGQTYYVQVDGFMDAQSGGYISYQQTTSPCMISELSYNCEEGVSVALLNGTGTWKHFTASDNNYLISANDNGSYIGIIQMSLQTVEGDVRTDAAGQPYLNRNWTFTAESTPVEPFRIRFLFTQEEFDALAAASPTINTLEDLHLTRVAEAPCGDYNALGEIYAQVGSGALLDFGTTTLYAEFVLPDFSSFYLHGPEELVITNLEYIDPVIDFQQLTPNPAQQETVLSVGLQRAADLQIQLIQMDGTIISTRKESLLEGNHRLPLDLSHLPPGVYLVDVQSAHSRQAKRLIITQ